MPDVLDEPKEATYLLLQFVGLESELRPLELQSSLVDVSLIVRRVLWFLAGPTSAPCYVIGYSISHLLGNEGVYLISASLV